MKVSIGTIRGMLEALSVKTGKNLDRAGLNEMSELIEGLKDEYLYKKIFQEIKSKGDDGFHGIGQFHLNNILKFLEFKSLDEFEYHLSNPIDDQLMSLTGSYYSYVRGNYTQGLILRSPVRIYRDESRVVFELMGKDHSYRGEVNSKNGCLFVLMESTGGKSFHHVYKIGNRKQPNLLQGVFSGVSTAFDPIGGRTVLVRQEKSFEELSNRKEEVAVMLNSTQKEDNRIGKYFEVYANNNVSPNKSSDFGFDDLL